MASDNVLGTVVILERESIGSKQQVLATIAAGTHYPTGGKPIAASSFGMDSISTFQVVEQISFAVPTKAIAFDRTNSKLTVLVQDPTTGNYAEAADDSDQSLVICSVLIRGY